jgi:hypothetical protein
MNGLSATCVTCNHSRNQHALKCGGPACTLLRSAANGATVLVALVACREQNLQTLVELRVHVYQPSGLTLSIRMFAATM